MPEDSRAGAPIRTASTDAEWSRWMRMAQAGDQLAYERVLQAVVPYLATIARGLLAQPQLVDDAVQDILLIVHSVRHTYEPDRPLKPWLATIARRHCIDMERRRLRRARHESADVALLDAQPSPEPTPEAAMDRLQEVSGMRRAVESLPPRQRTALELMKLRDLSAHEASAQSGLSVSALKVACHRAIKSLGGRLLEPRDE